MIKEKKSTETLPINELDQREEESQRKFIEQLTLVPLNGEDPTKTI